MNDKRKTCVLDEGKNLFRAHLDFEIRGAVGALLGFEDDALEAGMV